MRFARELLAGFVGAAVAFTIVSGQQPAPAASKADFERLCGTCHEPERSTSIRRTRDQWLQTVNSMVARGAQGTDAELISVVEYLTREHGRVNVNLASAEDIALVLGLAPAEAAAIVQYRRERGTFEDAAGVARVPGVDAKKLSARSDAMVFGSRVASNAGRVPVAALTAANNWPSINGGPQRESWARAEAMLARSTVGSIQLIFSRKLDNQSRGSIALTPPLVLGNLISYRGFKEMLFVGGSSDTVYSIDAVLNRVLWTSRLVVADKGAAYPGANCPGALMGIVMPGSAATVLGGTAAIRRPGAPPFGAAAPARNDLVAGLAGGFGRNGLVLAVASDGNVHPLYQSNGAAFGAPIKFLPARSNVRGLNFYDNVLYASTIDACGGPNAVYAVDLASEKRTVTRFETNGGSGGVGTAGPAIGTDGTVYVQLADGRGTVAGDYRDTVVALTPRDLKVKDFFTPAAGVVPAGPARGITPVVFRWNDSDVVVSASADGRLFALDSSSLGGADHHTPLAQTASLGSVRSAFASWEDPDTGLRWIYVPVWVAPKSSVAFPLTNGAPSHGAVAAFTLDRLNGRPVLTPRWISRDIMTPTVAIANGLLFALSSGDQRTPAVLYALDAATGRQLYTSGESVTGAAGTGSRGLAVANGRVYFTTQDNTVYCFGIPTEH